jgi:hypothetical protein
MPKRDISGFIAHWSAATPSERANSQAFLLELCDLLAGFHTQAHVGCTHESGPCQFILPLRGGLRRS